ncbi:MAG: beta-ketoacyl-[acyl-carrier-protein] synthase family protein, partial [Opitutales bacterium]
LDAAFQIKGASCGFASACASSGHALGYACDAIRLGRQQRALVVGAEDGDPEQILAFAAMRALSPSTEPDTASRPFDAKRDGFVGTGGATALILESEASLAARGGTAMAEILGWGQASDGYNVAQSHPDGDGLARAIDLCLRDAGLDVGAVDYVNAHATSTPIGDLSEIRALKTVFGDQPGPAISSTKALTGHGLSLASAMEAGFTVLGMQNGFTPGNAHFTEPDPELGQLRVIPETLPEAPKVALSNSSGFGGANVCIALGRA